MVGKKKKKIISKIIPSQVAGVYWSAHPMANKIQYKYYARPTCR